MDEEEVFVPCPDYPDLFMVSQFGNLYSLRSQRLVSQTPNHKGYLTHATKVGGRNGKAINVRVHVQVAKAFVPNYDRDNCAEVNHVNTDKGCNHYDNLEWMTRRENMDHAVLHGRCKKLSGLDNPSCFLTREEELEIIRLSKNYSQREIARRMGVSRTVVSRALARNLD